MKISARNYGGGIPQMLEKCRRIISFISWFLDFVLQIWPNIGDDFQVLPVKWHRQNMPSNQASKCSQVCTAHMQMNLALEAHGIGAATSGAEKTSCNKYYFSVNTTCLASTRQCFDGKLMRSNSIPKGTSTAAAMHSCWIQISPTALSSHHHSYLLRLKNTNIKALPTIRP